MSAEVRTRTHAAVLAVTVLLALGLLYALFVQDRTDPARRAAANAWPGGGFDPEEYTRREAGDPLAIGSPDAPVVMNDYLDFRCGSCTTFAREIEPVLVEKYVNSGQLRIEWRNVPLLGEDSARAARAAWAAGQQGRFRQFRALALAEGTETGALSESSLRKMAAKAGVPDPDRFSKDLHGRMADAAIVRDQAEAEEIGITSLPFLLINGQPVKGSLSLAAVTQAIEKALRAREDSMGLE
ncbi:DsbA family protein [Streptomyces yaizuensis]|uniref:Thioredoxin domain-containing protein n=1 Tax=Streptomyces yaizuensis TaxID=2989713 RepID=A0ABQ5P6F4_9ACTN|nr:thioredoxin domain-containing protein [Streptomyces sp. YSPA8]GLF98177.1 thioredoxin domain-containing protein [Streptomyces sp. YSPA8]